MFHKFSFFNIFSGNTSTF